MSYGDGLLAEMLYTCLLYTSGVTKKRKDWHGLRQLGELLPFEDLPYGRTPNNNLLKKIYNYKSKQG